VTVAVVAVTSGLTRAADLTASLKKGTPDLKSISCMAFAPEGILLVGDPQSAAIFAIATGDTKPNADAKPLNTEGVDGQVAGMLGTTPQNIQIKELVVNPASGAAYLGVMRGAGADATPVIVRVENQGKLTALPLKDVPFAKAALPNPAGDRSRMQSITKISFVDGRVIVAGLSNEEWASTLRAIPFPFATVDQGASVQIYHGAHGAFETRAPVRTFAACEINGEANLLAAYTCTPLVKIPLSELKPGAKVKGATIAELGNRNNPLDMIVYKKGGKEFILMANSSRGTMKIPMENVERAAGITNPVGGGSTAGAKYDTIADLKGVVQMDRVDNDHALVLMQTPGGMNLKTIDLP
jgi:hypothetical protein